MTHSITSARRLLRHAVCMNILMKDTSGYGTHIVVKREDEGYNIDVYDKDNKLIKSESVELGMLESRISTYI